MLFNNEPSLARDILEIYIYANFLKVKGDQ